MATRSRLRPSSNWWVASLGMATVYLGALPRETFEHVYRRSPDVVFAGRFAPLPAARTPERFLVSGRWPFGSGCLDASLIGVAISIPSDGGGLTRVAVVPRDKIRIEDKWDTIGLVGTGSHDMVLEDVLVPERWSLLWGSAPSVDVPVYRYPSLPLTAQAFAVVGLGCARRAISEFTSLAHDSMPIFSRSALRDRDYARAGIARSEALLSAARAFLYEATDHAWKHVHDGGGVPVEQNNRVRLASTHLAHVASDVARRCWELAGTAALHRDHILVRCIQDCFVVAQHVYLSEGNFETAGRAILEFEPGSVAP